MIDHCLVRKKRIHSPSLETLFKQLLIVMDGYEQCCGSDDLGHVHQKKHRWLSMWRFRSNIVPNFTNIIYLSS